MWTSFLFLVINNYSSSSYNTRVVFCGCFKDQFCGATGCSHRVFRTVRLVSPSTCLCRMGSVRAPKRMDLPHLLWLFLIFSSKGNHIHMSTQMRLFGLVSGIFFSVTLTIIDFMVQVFLSLFLLPSQVCSSLEWSMVVFFFFAPPWLLNAHSYRNMSMLRENMFGGSKIGIKH